MTFSIDPVTSDVTLTFGNPDPLKKRLLPICVPYFESQGVSVATLKANAKQTGTLTVTIPYTPTQSFKDLMLVLGIVCDIQGIANADQFYIHAVK